MDKQKLDSMNQFNHKAGDRTPKGREFTDHGAERANQRRYTVEDIDSIIDNWTDKAYQPGGKTVYIKSNLYGYDVVVIDKNGKSICSVMGGNGKRGAKNTLTQLEDVIKMLKNNGGYYTTPMP